MIASELLPLIDPKLHPRYSPNLHAWIRQQWGDTNCQIVVTNTCEFGPYIGAIDAAGWVIGSQLNSVLCNGKRANTWALTPNHHSLIAGVDEAFWPRYIRDGRCAIDQDHQGFFIGDETRWNLTGSVRECLWCGHHVQVKLDWTEIVAVNHSAWVPA
jgi:hypothetical protein